MRTWHRAAAVAAALLAAGSITGAVAQADTAQSSDTLYVNNAAGCSDSGGGSQATPFCTIQAAADVVNPGQTIIVAGGRTYAETVALTRSGTPTAPVTITSTAATPGGMLAQLAVGSANAATLTLSGVHDVKISFLKLMYDPSLDGIDVINSHDVTLDRLYVNEDYYGAPGGEGDSGVAVDGASSNITVSRSRFYPFRGYGVQVQPGASGITLTTNFIASAGTSAISGGVRASGATGAITSNTVSARCASGIAIDGGSTVVAENNHVAAVVPTSCLGSTVAGLVVAPDSVSTVRADYNAFYAATPSTRYLWDGAAYTTAAAFSVATGQGAHDVDAPSGLLSPATLPEGSPLIDSADPDAPGELATDLNGNPRVDDLFVPNTGVGYVDRGAVERQYRLVLAQTVTPAPAQGIVPLTVSLEARPTNVADGWTGQINFVFDFGDGSATIANTTGTASHTYTEPGLYNEVVKATPDGGLTGTGTTTVLVGTTTAPTVSISAGPALYAAPFTGLQSIMPGSAEFTFSSSALWEVGNFMLDFGDGKIDQYNNTVTAARHQYDKPGTYSVVLTQTDVFGVPRLRRPPLSLVMVSCR